MTRPLPWRREITAPFHILQSELNRLMEEYWNPNRLGPAQPPPIDLEQSGWSPAIDVFETPDELVVLVELPGVEPSSIDLSVTGNVLNVRGVKAAEGPTEGHRPLQEREFGSFHRQIALSTDVNFEASQAEVKLGVLKVRLPKQAAARSRTIPVQHA